VGISPKRFLQYLTKEHAKKLIENSRSLLDVSYEAGLSGPGRLHELFVNCEAVTPGEYKKRGAGLRIDYGFHPSPFGELLLAVTERGITNLDFVRDGNRGVREKRLKAHWPRAELKRDPQATAPWVPRIFDIDPGREPSPLHLFIQGTNFQIKVWEALLKIPLGQAVTYQDIARSIDKPRAARAVGNAVGGNPISFLIPCHRVLRKAGEFGNYGGGPARKKAILGWESAYREKASERG
jgi:AraC family transcriptional regulator of adaptative response/methylated-DNA-[protein]-cysteine methyltransferase